MTKNFLFIRIFLCVVMTGVTLYAFVNTQNELMRLRLKIPSVDKEVSQFEEENRRLKLEIERFESPVHLMELARKPEFGHLKYPLLKDVIVIGGSDEWDSGNF